MKRLSSYPPHPPNFRFSERKFYILWNKRKCCSNRSSGAYPLNQGHMTQLPLSVNTWFYTPLLQILASHWSQNLYFYSAVFKFYWNLFATASFKIEGQVPAVFHLPLSRTCDIHWKSIIWFIRWCVHFEYRLITVNTVFS